MKLNSLIKSNVNPVNMIKVQFNDPSSASGYFDAYEGELKNLSAHYKNLKVINCVISIFKYTNVRFNCATFCPNVPYF